MASERGIEQTSDRIGKYLLAGWVLTDKVCRTQNCNVPLLRSKDSVTWFCVNCEEKPGKSQVNVQSQTSDDMEMSYNVQDILLKAAEVNRQEKDPLNPQFSSIVSAYNSEEIIKDEQRSRREQSQRASQSIGRYLLSGWALIDEICPNESCFGIPLIRDRNKKKYCVNCRNYYVSELDLKQKIAQSDFSQPAASPAVGGSPAKYELKHDIDTKEIESTLQFENTSDAHVEDQRSSSEARLKSIMSNDVLQESISSLSSTLSALCDGVKIRTMNPNTSMYLSSDIRDIREMCDTIKSCAQALEILMSLRRNNA